MWKHFPWGRNTNVNFICIKTFRLLFLFKLHKTLCDNFYLEKIQQIYLDSLFALIFLSFVSHWSCRKTTEADVRRPKCFFLLWHLVSLDSQNLWSLIQKHEDKSIHVTYLEVVASISVEISLIFQQLRLSHLPIKQWFPQLHIKSPEQLNPLPEILNWLV